MKSKQFIKTLNHKHNIHAVLNDTDNYILIENIKNWDHININQLNQWLKDIGIECELNHITLNDIGLQYDKMYECVTKEFYDSL